MIWQLSDIDEKRACKVLAVSRFSSTKGISNQQQIWINISSHEYTYHAN